MDKLIALFYGKTGRFNYFMSLLIVAVAFYYLYEFYLMDNCLVCNPLLSIPWRDILELFVMVAIGGAYSCLICLLLANDYSYSLWPSMVTIVATLFFFIQTVKRCHDVDFPEFGALIPFFCPLYLLFKPGVKEDSELRTPFIKNIVKVIWGSKWLILALLCLSAYIHHENNYFIHQHYKFFVHPSIEASKVR